MNTTAMIAVSNKNRASSEEGKVTDHCICCVVYCTIYSNLPHALWMQEIWHTSRSVGVFLKVGGTCIQEHPHKQTRAAM